MIAYLKQFVNTFCKPLFSSLLGKERRVGKILILANILLVFFLILLSNVGVLPVKNVGDFTFFTVLFLGLALYRPGWSFLFFVGTIALENINLAPAEIGIMVRPYQFFAALTIIAIIIRLLVKRLNFKIPKFTWPDFMLLIFATAGFVSTLGAANKEAGFKHSIIAASFVAIYFLIRMFIQGAEDLKKIIPFFLSSSVIVVFYGIWQNIRFAQGLSNFESMPGRPNATFTEPDWLGVFLVFLLGLIYILIYQIKESRLVDDLKEIRISQLYKKMFLYIYLTLLFILLVITVSRSAWLGAAAVTFIFLISILIDFSFGMVNWQWKKLINGIMLIIATAVVALLYAFTFKLTNFQLFNRFQSTGTGLQKITVSCANEESALKLKQVEQLEQLEQLKQFSCRHINLEEIQTEKSAGNIVSEIYRKDPNVSIRKEIYQKSWQEIKNHPIMGIGWGSIGSILGKDERGMGLNSSNIFLEVWLGSGVLGFASFVLVWIYIFVGSLFKMTKAVNPLQKSTFLFIILSWIGITAVNLFNAGIFLGIFWLFLAVSVSTTAKKI